jgi:uncharacterized membrane protein
MWPRFWKPLVIVIPSAAVVLAVLYMTYRFIDPIPPRHFVIAAGMAGSGYDNLRGNTLEYLHGTVSS